MAEEIGQATEQPDVMTRLLNHMSEAPPEQPEETEEPVEATTEEAPEVVEEEKPEETSEVTIDPDAPLIDITYKVEGGAEETKKWSLNEMRAGVMMQKDYQRKTAELARARENLSQEVVKMVEPERQMYQQQLQALQQAVNALVLPEFQNINWETLAVENPAEYVRLSAKAQKAQQAIALATQQQAELQRKAYNEAAQQSKRKLEDPIDGIPGWGDQLYTTLIQEASKQYSFTPEEVAQVVDWRMIKVLHDAYQYSKVKAAKPAVTKKISVVPKVLKPGAQGDSGDSQAQEDKQLRARLQKTGDLKDATALYLSRQKGRR